MKRTRIALLLLSSLMVVSVASATAQNMPPQTENALALANAAAASSLWSSERIDRPTIGPGDDRGEFASVAVGGETTYVSYYDASQQDLKLARYPIDASGNCGPYNRWFCQTIDSGGDVGQYSSIATAPAAAHRGPGIAYYDANHLTLKFAEYVCQPAPCALAVSTILPGSGTPVGRHPSLKYDATGGVHIAFQAIASNGFTTFAILEYAHWVSGVGNCLGYATNHWQCDLIDFGPDLGSFISLDLNSSNQPRIAYYDALNGDLKFAVYLGTGTGNCAFGLTWWCGKVDSVGNVGRFVSMQVDRATNSAQIAYYDATNGKLKHAYSVTGLGNCGDQFPGNTVWRCETIANMGMGSGSGLTLAGISLAVNAKGQPYIAYQDASDDLGPAVLRLARPAAAAPGESLNCGPSNGPSVYSWVCNILDMGDIGINEGDYVSIAFSPAGLATIAYHESDTFYDNTGYLKVLQQLAPLWLPLLRK